MVQPSHLYMTTGKTTALIIWTFVKKVMTLLFNALSRLVITFLPRGKNVSIAAAVTSCSDFRAQENKTCHCFHCFPIYLPWSDGIGCRDLSFWMFSFKPVFTVSSFTFIKRNRGANISKRAALFFNQLILITLYSWSLSTESQNFDTNEMPGKNSLSIKKPSMPI